MIKLFRFLKPYRILVAFVLGLTLLQTLSQLYLPTLMANIVDLGIVNSNISYIMKIGGLMLLVAGGGMFFSIAAHFYSSKVAMGFGKTLRAKVFSCVENFSQQEFDKIGTSSLMNRTTNDIMQVQQVLAMILQIMVMAPLMFIVGIIIAISKDPGLSWVIIAVIPVVTLVIILIVKKGTPLFKTLQKRLDKLNLILREGLIGIRVIRSFNRMDREKKRFDETSLDFINTSTRVNRIMAILSPVMMLVLNFSMIMIIWFGSFQVNNGHLQVGNLMAFIQYITQIMFSLVIVSVMFVIIPRAAVSAGRVSEILDMVPEIKDGTREQPVDSQEGFVEFQNVSFRYPDAEKPVISNISFCAKPGEVTAIIGGTGAGKSTLVSLIPRFYDVNDGRVLVDGVDVCSMTQEKLRAKIGFAPQKTVLFSGTIAENIRYGKDGATDEEIKNAADIAQATDFISETNEGFDSKIAQGGTNVSGGQKQRLAIARTLVRNPEIYIFDDSFSALDYRTEARLREALQKKTIDSTVIMVAQRISTVMEADRIIVLDKGQIEGIGNHQELAETCESYREIISSQLSKEETA